MRNYKVSLILLVVHIYIDISYSQVLNTIVRLQNLDHSGFIMVSDASGVEAETVPPYDLVSIPPDPFLPIESTQSYVMTWRVNWGAANRRGSFIAAADENYRPSQKNRYLCLCSLTDKVPFIGIEPISLKPNDEDQKQRCLWRFVPKYDPENYVNNYQLTLPDNRCVKVCPGFPLMYCLDSVSNCTNQDTPGETLFKVLQNS